MKVDVPLAQAVLLQSLINLRESNKISAYKAIIIGTSSLLESPYFIALVGIKRMPAIEEMRSDLL